MKNLKQISIYAVLIVLAFTLDANAQCWQNISSNDGYTLAVKQDGSLWAWGRNYHGRLGDGNASENFRLSPFKISTTNDWKQVATSRDSRSYAIKTDGTLWTWGDGINRFLGDSSHANILRPTQILSGNDWSSITSGFEYSLAIKTDGTLWAWGYNLYGEIGNGTYNDVYRPIQIGTDNNWLKIASNNNCSVALKTDRTLWAWGQGTDGQLGDGMYSGYNVPTQIGNDNNWQDVDISDAHILGLKTNGTIWSAGYNRYGCLGNNTTLYNGLLTQIGTENTWQSINVGQEYSMATKTDNSLWVWGYNGYGQLGLGDLNNRLVPTRVGISSDWQALETTTFTSFAIKTDGTLWGWGTNFGSIGNNTQTPQIETPVQIGGSCTATGINNILLNNNISIVPNTVTTTLTITMKNELTPKAWQIINPQGKTILTGTFNNDTQSINVNSLKAGVYVIKTKFTTGEIGTQKFIKI